MISNRAAHHIYVVAKHKIARRDFLHKNLYSCSASFYYLDTNTRGKLLISLLSAFCYQFSFFRYFVSDSLERLNFPDGKFCEDYNSRKRPKYAKTGKYNPYEN